MKKLLIAALFVAAIGSSAFAKDPKSKITFTLKNSFETQFAGAENVSWSFDKLFTKATFQLDGESLEAFYLVDGEAVGYSRKIELKKLPISAIQKIKKEYASYSIAEAIEFTQADGDKSYYISLVDGNKQQILQVSLYGDVSKFTSRKY